MAMITKIDIPEDSRMVGRHCSALVIYVISNWLKSYPTIVNDMKVLLGDSHITKIYVLMIFISLHF